MNWLKAALAWLRKLPIAAWIKPLWKQGLKDLLQKRGDEAQILLRAAVAADGPAAIERVVDGWVVGIIDGLEWLPLPKWAEDKIGVIVANHGATMKASLSAAVTERGPGAIDVAFDSTQAILIAKVDAL